MAWKHAAGEAAGRQAAPFHDADHARLDEPARGGEHRTRQRRRMSPEVAGSLGFVAGIAVWHALGFWAFLATVVSGQPSMQSSVLATLLLGAPSTQDTAMHTGAASSQNGAARTAGAAIAVAAVASCVTLVRSSNGEAAMQQACPRGAGGTVPRRLAVRADRQPVQLNAWTTATTAQPAATSTAAEAAAAQDRAEVNALLAGRTPPFSSSGWAPVVVPSHGMIETGSVR